MKKNIRETLDGKIARLTILFHLISNKTISEIEKIMNLDRPTTYYHLKILENDKLIKRIKDTKSRGQPVKLILNTTGDKLGKYWLKTLKEIEKKNNSVMNMWREMSKHFSIKEG